MVVEKEEEEEEEEEKEAEEKHCPSRTCSAFHAATASVTFCTGVGLRPDGDTAKGLPAMGVAAGNRR